MKIAFISDIHSNLEAFNTVLQLLKNRVDRIYSCGDIVGYGPDPEESVQLFSKNGIKGVRGNHDSAVIDDSVLFEFNEYAKLALLYTKRVLSIESINFLKSLPIKIIEDNFTIFHGFPSPSKPFKYIVTDIDAMEANALLETPISFYGHTHVPCILEFSKDNKLNVIQRNTHFKYKLKDGFKYLINVGSIGQPRDGNPKGSFVIFDNVENSVEFVRFEYNIEAVFNKIIERNLPSYLGERLFSGF